MRYMGDAQNPVPGIVIPPLNLPGFTPAQPGGGGVPGVVFPPAIGGGGMDPNLKAQMLAQAPSVPDATAHDMLDVIDATHYGSRTRMMRITIGAAIGVAAGFLLAKVL